MTALSSNMPAVGVSWAGCALLLLASLSTGRALYFHIGETEKKCFIEEIPDETMVIGKYRTQLWDKQTGSFLPSTPGLGMHVEVKDPDTKIILSRQYGSEGRFTFTSHTPGEHQICLHSNSTKMVLFAGGKLRVHLDIQVGEHTNNYPEIAAKDKLTELQLRVRQLLDQVDQIQKEQNYQRYREERFRMTSESTNQRVLWWSITQTLILLVTGVWQMRHLKSFFEAKKLVHWSRFAGADGGTTFQWKSGSKVLVLQGLQVLSDTEVLVGNQAKHHAPNMLYSGTLTPIQFRLQKSVLHSDRMEKQPGPQDKPFQQST